MVIKCPKCNHYVSDTTAVCPHCGAVLKEGVPEQMHEPVSGSQEEKLKTQEDEIIQQVNLSVEKPMEKRELRPQQKAEPKREELTVEEQKPAPVASPPSPAPVASPPASAPTAPPPLAYQQAEKSNVTLYAVIAVLALLICGVGGYLYYDNVYLPEKIDREAPRYYTMANMVVLRSSRSSGADFNKIGSLPFGTELITYEYDSEWARVKVATPNGEGKKLEGFVARPYILGKKDFFLLNSLFGNQDSREVIVTTKCRIALLDYFKTHGYIGVMDNQIRTEAGITTSPNGENEWQVFCKPKDAKPNSVLFKRLYNKNSQFTDFAVIINNITNGNRKLLYFYFDEDETPHLYTEQEAPREGYIKDAFISYDRYSGDGQLNVVYSY